MFPRIGGVNVGDPENYRVPDGVLQRERALGVWHPTAALVVEILSPGDETFEKLSFYAEHQVDELLIVDPAERRVQWLGLVEAEYQPINNSGLIDLGPLELQEQIDWPQVA
jgi:Uma2 family endonuclease